MMLSQFIKLVSLTFLGLFCEAFDKVNLEMLLKRGLESYVRTGEKTVELQNALNALQLPQLFRKEDNRGFFSNAACLVCNVGVGVIKFARRNGAEKGIIVDLLEKLCVWLNIESGPVCSGAIRSQAIAIGYIVDNKLDLSAKRVCSILLQGTGCIDPDRKDWSIEIPPWRNKTMEKKLASKSQSIKILQLTDIHYDPEYVPGSNTACDEPLCCQGGSFPVTLKDAAGFWGDYRNCDTPGHVLLHTLDHILTTHSNLDYVYFTGDIINHKVWDTNITNNKKVISDVLRQFKTSFGTMPVFPILGNHESHPANLFSSHGINDSDVTTQWIFDLSANDWQLWLPSSTRETILKGGYYTVLVKSGFRLIALNSNVCYIFNWWLLYNDVDPFGQLHWLVETLLKAEESEETVHILSHVPTSDDSCFLNWSKEYAKIINRFSHIIAAQFNGHTHKDQTVIFFNMSNPAQAINVAFNGGSITSYTDLNPNYKIYDMDSQTMEILDFESWTYNVTEANVKFLTSPRWYKLYSFKDAFGLDSLKPQAIARLAERMSKDRTIAEKYFRFKYREADTVLAVGCDDECHISNICYMVTSYPDHTLHCEILTDIYFNVKLKGVKIF